MHFTVEFATTSPISHTHMLEDVDVDLDGVATRHETVTATPRLIYGIRQ